MPNQAPLAAEPDPDEAGAAGTAAASARFPLSASLLAAATIVAAALLGSPVFLRSPSVATFAPVAAVIAAIAMRKPIEGALTAGLGAGVGLALAHTLSRLPGASDAAASAGEVLVAAAVAAGVAYVALLALERAERLRPVLVAGALALVVIAMWYSVTQISTIPGNDGTTFIGMLSSAPVAGPNVPTEGLYLAVVDRMRTGGGYYTSAGDALARANEGGGPARDLSSPLAFPPPTLYASLSLLPPEGIWILLACLACGTVATVSAYMLASRFVSTPAALVSASAVAGYFSGVGLTVTVLDASPYAGASGLLAVTLLAASLAGTGRRAAFAWSGATAALLAALLREPAALFLVAGLAAGLLDAPARRLRLWLPWALGCVLAVAALAAHWTATSTVVGTLPPQAAGAAALLGGGAIVAAFGALAAMMGVPAAVVWLFALAGLTGAVVAPRPPMMRAALAGALALGAAVPMVVSPGTIGVIAPALLAAAPLAFALVPASRVEAD